MAFHIFSTWTTKKEKENLQVPFPPQGKVSVILHISRHWRDDTHTLSPKLTTQQCLPWALAGNHYSIWFVLSGNSRATQTGPAVLTFLTTAPSSGRAAWTTRSGPGTCARGGSCSSTTSPHRWRAPPSPPPPWESLSWSARGLLLPPFTPHHSKKKAPVVTLRCRFKTNKNNPRGQTGNIPEMFRVVSRTLSVKTCYFYLWTMSLKELV